ncbi:hypothetical protein HGM15179_004302 [Zosterops borbonicus]|uniref:Uncharacterized protein n=1 Tax=Zosterops borbonicus TaxID=364589 RepID=A0A8K1LR16_9PASS|nr:hypothetical protein HGM15179_004302 [Zosterops borbonicus]
MQHLRCCLTSTEYRGEIVALVLLAALFLIQARMPLAFLTTWTHTASCSAADQHSQVLFCWTVFQPLFSKPVVLLGGVVTQVQDSALCLIEPPAVFLSPLTEPIQIPLQSLSTLKQINTPTQFSVICKFTEGAIDPNVQVIDKDVKRTNLKTEPWGASLATSCQMDLASFTTTLLAWPCNQFFTH